MRPEPDRSEQVLVHFIEKAWNSWRVSSLSVAAKLEREDLPDLRRGGLQRLSPGKLRPRAIQVDLIKGNPAAVARALRVLYPPHDVPAVKQNDVKLYIKSLYTILF